MAATSLRTIQTLSTTSGQAWTVARTTTAAAAVSSNPAAAHSHAHHLTLYNTSNPATHNPASDTASSQPNPIPNHTTTASSNSTSSPTSPLNTSSTSTTATTPTTPTGSSTVAPATTTAHFSRPTINQYQSINSHNQYIYNHHLQLSHNHSQQQQQRRALQLQSQAHAQQRQQGQGQGYQQQRQHQQFQGYNQGQRSFQDQQFFTGAQNSNNPYNARQGQPQRNQNTTMMHPRAPLHYRSASPPSGAGAGSAIQASTTNPFRVQALPTPPPHALGQNQHRKSPPPTPNRRRSASIRMAPPSLPLPSQMMQQNAGVSASPAAYVPQQSLPSPKSAIRFDPFADESDVLEGAGLGFVAEKAAVRPPLSVTTPLSRTPSPPHVQQHQSQPNVPYTIQIPAAGAREIQQYALRTQLGGHRLNGPRRSPSPPSPIARPVSPPKTSASIQGAPTPQSSPTRTEGANPFGVAAASTLSSSPASEVPSRTPSPPVARPARPQPTPNLSKLVAGILLNRVHAVGKPMRRNPRCGDDVMGDKYVRSALRWEVSV
ncbi:hypothetical protein BJ165DRAFT_1528554 [Panaeolus papilionaceus]|nr:hypothetical protein BJ165DRAFT_1528554 [Panaeolus papilionaceus]